MPTRLWFSQHHQHTRSNQRWACRCSWLLPHEARSLACGSLPQLRTARVPQRRYEQAGAPLTWPDCFTSTASPGFAPLHETRTPPEWLACGSGPGDRPGSSEEAQPRRTQVPCRRQPSGRPGGQGQQPVARLRPRTRCPGLAVDRRRGYGGDVPSGGTLSEEPQGLAGESGPETRAGLKRITSTGTLAAGAMGANHRPGGERQRQPIPPADQRRGKSDAGLRRCGGSQRINRPRPGAEGSVARRSIQRTGHSHPRPDGQLRLRNHRTQAPADPLHHRPATPESGRDGPGRRAGGS